MPQCCEFGLFLVEFKLFSEVADDETRGGDITAFYDSPSHSNLTLCISTLCSLTLDLRTFPDVFLCEPCPETCVEGTKASSLTQTASPEPSEITDHKEESFS